MTRLHISLVILCFVSSSGLAQADSPLTLETVLEQVESNHPKLRGGRLLNDIAAAKVLEKRGAFDPSVALATGFQRYNSSSEPGKAKNFYANSATVFRTDPSGIKWEAGWVNNQGGVKSPSSSTGDAGELFVGASIPLLRGLNINDKSVQLEQARIMETRVQFGYKQLRLAVLLDAGSAYYNWVTSVMQKEIVEENLRLARQRAEQVAVSIEAGDKPRIDQVEADREVEKRSESLLKAERLVQKAAFKLALYLWNSQGEAQEVPDPAAAPRSLPETEELDQQRLATLQVKALEMRPELSRLSLQQDIVELDRDLARNQRLPQLDLKLRPGADMGFQGVGFTFKAGVELVIPLATRTADGRERAASIKLEKLSLEQVEMVRRILLQVQDAAGELEATRLRLQRALEVYRLAKELEEAERLKFSLGDSSLFLVNSRERSTVAAALKVLEIRNEMGSVPALAGDCERSAMRWLLVFLALLSLPVSAELSKLLSYQQIGDPGAFVSSGFHDWRTVSKYRSRAGLHAGYDIAMLAGAPVRVAWPGTVVAITPWYGAEYGVTVRESRGYEATYGHISPAVLVGEEMQVGEVLGTVVVDHLDVKMRDSAGSFVDFALLEWEGESAPSRGASAIQARKAQQEFQHLLEELGQKRQRLRFGLVAEREVKAVEERIQALRELGLHSERGGVKGHFSPPPSGRTLTDSLLRSVHRAALPGEAFGAPASSLQARVEP
jgi:outer membrane protein TolC